MKPKPVLASKLHLQRSKLYSEAFRLVPGSPLQKKVMAQIKELTDKIKANEPT